MGERGVKLTLAYDGTDFCGWQRQKGDRSVQAELESALERMHGHEVRVAGSGRTDSGVHARGQVASFITDIDSIPVDRFVPALNSLLPQDVRILESREAPVGFNARFDARLRCYRYFMIPGGRALPSQRLYAWCLRSWPDAGKLNAMAACLKGERDFSAFCIPRDESLSRYRYVHGAAFFMEGGQLVFEISANAFLWRMVRSLVGSLVDFESKGLDAGHFRKVLESEDRSLAGKTAPAQGLFLWRVEY
jgi:tRNA pseudouridine38-40 synthase